MDVTRNGQRRYPASEQILNGSSDNVYIPCLKIIISLIRTTFLDNSFKLHVINFFSLLTQYIGNYDRVIYKFINLKLS